MQIDSITRNKDSPRIVNGLKFPELNDSFEQRVKSKPGQYLNFVHNQQPVNETMFNFDLKDRENTCA